ncbi:MAG: hypothetical protein WBG53_09010 [Rhodococcus sp. (in: high G+C Gram-positive bacteria)]|uniref:hypothetical protein n=1 Tax=Rhodococcus sp. BS-15 TaxID=1304954 RepID=UPI000FFC1931|nr:hypothetical protein [Rhodococcus sp. BS-15]
MTRDDFMDPLCGGALSGILLVNALDITRTTAEPTQDNRRGRGFAALAGDADTTSLEGLDGKYSFRGSAGLRHKARKGFVSVHRVHRHDSWNGCLLTSRWP